MEKYLLDTDYLNRKDKFKEEGIEWVILPRLEYAEHKDIFIKELFLIGKSITSMRNGRKNLADKHKVFYYKNEFILPDGRLSLIKVGDNISVIEREDDFFNQPRGWLLEGGEVI